MADEWRKNGLAGRLGSWRVGVNAIPTVTRELRVGSRRWNTYWIRVGMGLTFIAAGSFVVANAVWGRSVSRDMLGPLLFGVLVGIAFFYSLTNGIQNTADCISQEKRDGTLGLLFLTDLKAWDIILGKLFAKGLVAFYSLLAGVPILGLSLLLGGVTGTQFWQMALALLNASFFSHAVGLMVSTFSTQPRRANSAAVLIMLTFVIFLPATVAVLSSKGIPGTEWLLIFCPALPLTVGYLPFIGGAKAGFWVPLLAVHALSWGFLALAMWHLPKCWQDRPKTPLKQRWRQWLLGSCEARTRFRKCLIDINPFYWLVCRSRFERAIVWTVLASLAACWFWIRLENAPWQGNDELVLAGFTAAALNLFCRGGVSAAAAVHFEEQRLNGSLEFLLSCTPLTVPEIIQGQWLAIKRKWLWPVIVVLMADVMVFVLAAARYTDSDRFGPLALILSFTVLLPLDLICTGWVGMARGLKSKRIRRAGGEAFILNLVFPLMIFWSLMASVAFLGYYFSLSLNFGFWTVFLTWIAVSVTVQVAFAINARRILLTDFRLLASPMSEGSFGLWRKCGRMFGMLIHDRR